MENLMLSEERAKLLSHLLKQEGLLFHQRNELPRRANSDEYPLSFAQQRLWFLHQMAPKSPHYNIPMPLRLTGTLDIRLLKRCLTELVQRHEVLRATFEDMKGQPVQRISPAEPLTLPLIDLENLATGNPSAALDRLIKEDAGAPFDLSRGPLFRCRLLRVGTEEHVLSITFHHIVADGACFSIFLRELVALYQQGSDRNTFKLPALPIQFADFAQWQRQRLQRNEMAEDLRYWKTQLEDAPPVLPLATDCPRPTEQTYEGDQCTLTLSPSLTKALNVLSRQQGVTLFTTLLTAFTVLLYRYSAQRDIVVGTPVANRGYPETQNLIGTFINTIPLRTRLSPNQAFADLLAQVSRNVLAGYEHQELPFEQLVEALQAERHQSHTPLFQVMFNFKPISTPVPEMNMGSSGLTLRALPQPGGIAKFDLTLHVEEADDGLRLLIDYPTALYWRESIERMLGHLHTLLAAIVSDPLQAICKLPLLTDAEQNQIVYEWNHTTKARVDRLGNNAGANNGRSEKNKCLHELFEDQVQATPDNIAVAYGDNQLTYQQLNDKSNALARYLQQQGVAADSLVATCMNCSFDLIVVILGILKAGGAYVPIDPEYPPARIQYILQDSGAQLLLTQSKLVDRGDLADVVEHFQSVEDRRVIAIDRDWERISKQAGSIKRTARNHHLAYVIYTSGTTGNPKGTLIEHRSVSRICHNPNYIEIQPSDKLLQLSNVAFDGSVFDIFGALLNGAELVLIDRCDILDLDKLATQIEVNNVTVFFVTTALFNSLVDHSPSCLASVRKILFGGEQVSVSHVNKALGFLGTDKLIHVYGPTESTVFSSHYSINKQSYSNNIPIGKAVTDTQLYIIDTSNNVQPIGVPGELMIAGAGLARNYLNQEELSAEKFIDNPFQPGTRLYRTGDLARWLADGNIEFLGRIDQQVKVRGFRVELGEIEAVLTEQADVHEAVVIAKSIHNNTKLIAFYVPANDIGTLDEQRLRDALQKKLPEAMIPSAFVALDSLPLISNGKVDRKALLQRDVELTCAAMYHAPRTPIEQEVSCIFAEILRVKPVGIYDNFFVLGGHSLLVTQAVSRLQERFKTRITLRNFFDQPCVEHVASLIEQQQKGQPTIDDYMQHIDTHDDSEQVTLDMDQLSDAQVDLLLNSIAAE